MRFLRFPFVLVFAAVQLAVVGLFDYITSYEISVSIWYYFPIAYAAWFLGRWWSFGFGVTCAATITRAEIASGHTFSHAWMAAEVAAMRLLGFGFVSFSFNYFKRSIALEKEKVRRLEGMLTFCNRCTRVQDESGNWMDIRTFIREQSSLTTRLRCAQNARRVAYAEVGRCTAGVSRGSGR